MGDRSDSLPRRALELSTALYQIAVAAQTALGADRATCYATDVRRGTVSAMYTTETDPGRRDALERALGRGPGDLPVLRALVAAGRVLAVPDVSGDDRIPDQVGATLAAGAILGVRLEHESVRTGGRRDLLGALFCTFAAPREFAAHEHTTARGMALLASLALAHAHVAVDTARSLRLARGLESEQAALRRLATLVALDHSGDGEVHRHAAEEAARALGVDAALVVRFDNRGVVVTGTHGIPIPAGDLLPARGAGVLARMVHHGAEPTIADFAAVDESPARRLAAALGYRTGVAAPVRIGERVWGALIAVSHRPARMPADGSARLAGFAELVAVAVANAETRERLVAQSRRDPLTGLANHGSFFDRLRSEVERARRRARDLSLVVIDLDNFKRINDRFGHLVGDGVLVEFARRLVGHARAEDMLGRIGGEEFAWLIPECDVRDAHDAAERARRAVESEPFADVGYVTMSAGVATRADDAGARELFAAADAALYRAKAEGRNRSVVAAPA